MASSSDVICDIVCFPCNNYNISSEAVFCCNQCSMQFCRSCVKYHEKLFRRHEEFGLAKKEKWITLGNTSENQPREMCEVHDDKLAKMHCADHDKLACMACLFLEHRFCNVLSLIKDKKAGISTDTQERKTEASEHTYSTKDHKTYNIKENSDASNCDPYGCCQLPNGHIILADYGNKKVKELNKQYTLIGSVDIQEKPWGICHVAGNEVAITVRRSDEIHEIQFVSANNGKLALCRKFQTDHKCISMVHHNGQLYVTSDTAVFIYTMTGQLVKKVFEDTSGDKFEWRLAVSHDGNKLFILNYGKHLLITTDMNGKELYRLSGEDMKYAHGICLAPNGNIFVCAYQAVVQIDKDGKKKLGTVAWSVHGIKYTRSVCFNKNTSELIVANCDENNIIVLKME